MLHGYSYTTETVHFAIAYVCIYKVFVLTILGTLQNNQNLMCVYNVT